MSVRVCVVPALLATLAMLANLCVAQPPKTLSALVTPGEWLAKAGKTVEVQHEKKYLPLSQSGNSAAYYPLAYGIDGNTALFEATGDLKFLDRALTSAENMVKSAKASRDLEKSQFKDSFLAWPAFNLPGSSDTAPIQGGEYPLYDSYCWRYVARALRVVRQTPTVWADKTYRDRYESLLTFSETDVFRKWLARDRQILKASDSHLYRSRTHMSSHWAYIAMELSLLTSDAKLKKECQTVYINFNKGLPNYKSSMRKQLRPHPKNPAAYFWSDEWGKKASPGQDVSHGNNVVAYIIEAHELGIEWTRKDIDALCVLFKEIVWVQEGGKARYAKFVDGSGTGNGFFSDGFMKLGRYDETIQRRLQDHPIDRGLQFYGNAALNAKRLAERKK